jgi:hypothetical protein
MSKKKLRKIIVNDEQWQWYTKKNGDLVLFDPEKKRYEFPYEDLCDPLDPYDFMGPGEAAWAIADIQRNKT